MERYILQRRGQAHRQFAQRIIARQPLRAYLEEHHVLPQIFGLYPRQSVIANTSESRPEILHAHVPYEEHRLLLGQHDAPEQMLPIVFPSVVAQKLAIKVEKYPVAPEEIFTSQEELAALPEVTTGKLERQQPDDTSEGAAAPQASPQVAIRPGERRLDSADAPIDLFPGIPTASVQEARSVPVLQTPSGAGNSTKKPEHHPTAPQPPYQLASLKTGRTGNVLNVPDASPEVGRTRSRSNIPDVSSEAERARGVFNLPDASIIDESFAEDPIHESLTDIGLDASSEKNAAHESLATLVAAEQTAAIDEPSHEITSMLQYEQPLDTPGSIAESTWKEASHDESVVMKSVDIMGRFVEVGTADGRAEEEITEITGDKAGNALTEPSESKQKSSITGIAEKQAATDRAEDRRTGITSKEPQAKLSDTTQQATQAAIETMQLDEIARESMGEAIVQDRSERPVAGNSGQAPVARERRRSRRGLIEEHPSREKRQSSRGQASETSLTASNSQRLTPQETKAAIDALFQPTDELSPSPAQWLHRLQQSQWGNSRQSLTATHNRVPGHGREPSPVDATMQRHSVFESNRKVDSADENIQSYTVPENARGPYSADAPARIQAVPEDRGRSHHEVARRFAPTQEQSPRSEEMPQPGAIPPITSLQSTPASASSEAHLRHEQEATPAHNAALAALDSQIAEPLAQRARLFLRPLLGFDPVEVVLYRGATATQLGDAYRADAITVGQRVIMGGENSGEQTPEALGLLAHELTHVAHQHFSAYVPPVVSDAHQHSATAVSSPDISKQMPPTLSARSVSSSQFSSRSEEQLAREVEQRVIGYAREEEARPPHTGFADRGGGREASGQRAEAVATSTGSMEWGSLPAPWEPLPAWFTAALPAQEPQAAEVQRSESSAPIAHVSTGSELLAGTEINTGEVQRAATDRPTDQSRQAEAEDEQKQPEAVVPVMPDIDILAQQVYQLLKRRLDVERRRTR